MREINDLFGITVSKQTCYRARAEARTKLLGTLDDHYHMLPAYVAELKRYINRCVPSNIVQGLENAVSSLLPNAEHRNCARHIYANWKKKGHSTAFLKNLFWKAAKATTHEDFQRLMREMSSVNPQAAQDFEDIGIKKFCRAYINEERRCEVIDNNICECFNNYIMQARSKPIIDMLEEVRGAIMQRVAKKRELFSNRTDTLCPRIREVVEENKKKSRRCTLRHAGKYQFEVTDLGSRFVVDVLHRTCSCRYWELRGIQCAHAICCIHWVKEDPVIFVSEWLNKDVYQLAYTYGSSLLLTKLSTDDATLTSLSEPFLPPSPPSPSPSSPFSALSRVGQRDKVL
ncbi:uncharacterized protein LOC144702543 [Wolffia australiana]